MVPASVIAGANNDFQDSNQSEISVVRPTKLYVPPPEEDMPKTATRPTGRRNGCGSKLTTEFKVLAPYQHVGRTHVTQPSFTWHVPDEVVLPMKFQLYQDRSSPPLLEYDFESSQGIMTISLAEDQLELTIGQKYWWQVILYCEGRGRPAGSRFIGAELDVVLPSESVASRLAAAQDPVERAKILAAAGFWYDAFAEVNKRRNIQEVEIKETLLEDLERLEGDSRGNI